VARRESFSRAAEELSLTQSAVSQQVAALERQLGVRLLHRGRGGVRTTAAGELLLHHAGALADRLALAASQVAELAEAERRLLRVGAVPSALATVVPVAVAAVLACDPALDVRLSEGTIDGLAAAVRAGEEHAAVCFQDAAAPRREHPGTRRRDLGEEPMVLALPPRHRLAGRRDVRLADLAAEPWTAPSRDGLVARACRASGFEPRITLTTSDPLAIRGVVRAGLAVTLTPRTLAAELTGVGVATVRDGPSRSLYALLPDRGAHPAEAALVAELASAAG
jgi:DNA-binding transcriptional LysR family regulator